MEITIGICAEEIKEIIMEHIKTKGFNVTEDDISFVIGKEETVTGNAKKIKHRSEEHTSELQSRPHLVCRLLLEKKKKYRNT